MSGGNQDNRPVSDTSNNYVRDFGTKPRRNRHPESLLSSSSDSSRSLLLLPRKERKDRNRKRRESSAFSAITNASNITVKPQKSRFTDKFANLDKPKGNDYCIFRINIRNYLRFNAD